MRLPRVQLRRRIASLVESLGVSRAILRGRVRPPWLTVLTYHRVRERADSGGFDDGVVDATIDEFDEQIGMLRESFTFVGIDDVRAWLRGSALPENPVLVTFDDAYRECRDYALPILQRHGARAAFFVSTQQVEERRLFWWDRACYILRNARVWRATMSAYGGLEIELESAAEHRATEHRVLRLIKDRFGLDIDEFLTALAEACGVEWTRELEHSFADAMIATWDDVRALRAAGMDVQSHTRTHRVLQTLSAGELARELGGAREELEAILREPVRALAYPTGRPVDPRSDIARAVRDAGYELAFENAGGINLRFPRPSPLKLRRVPMAAGTPGATFETLLALPMLQ